jgi:hypothetical protein
MLSPAPPAFQATPVIERKLFEVHRNDAIFHVNTTSPATNRSR